MRKPAISQEVFLLNDLLSVESDMFTASLQKVHNTQFFSDSLKEYNRSVVRESAVKNHFDLYSLFHWELAHSLLLESLEIELEIILILAV
jgi:hypothetical protein